MNLNIHSSQLSFNSLSYNPTIISSTASNHNTNQFSPLSYYRRIKKDIRKNFRRHQTRFSLSCFKCFRYFTSRKAKCEC